jgi:hypothetical protein
MRLILAEVLVMSRKLDQQTYNIPTSIYLKSQLVKGDQTTAKAIKNSEEKKSKVEA